jgi:hypothetical protein
MKHVIGTILLLALGLAAPTLAAAQQGGCSRTGFRFGLGIAETSARWVVVPGQPCTGVLNPSGVMQIDRLSIEQGARVGVAGTGSRYQFAYNPRPGQSERDQFVLRIDFMQRGVRGVTRVRIDVVTRGGR